jgi:hypothetical protein
LPSAGAAAQRLRPSRVCAEYLPRGGITAGHRWRWSRPTIIASLAILVRY